LCSLIYSNSTNPRISAAGLIFAIVSQVESSQHVAMAKAALQNRRSKGETAKATATNKNVSSAKAGRPQKRCHRPFTCPVAGCGLSYGTSAGLHQHKRNKHPEMIQARGSHGSDMIRKFVCPVEGCDKSYDTSQGMYQHKNSKHPELVKRR